MVLTEEWEKRIAMWQNGLPLYFYQPLETVDLEGFVTDEQLTAAEAASRDFRPMPVGTSWGMKYEYGWFRARVAIPKAAEGRRVVLRVDGGDESAIYVNGRNAGARDRFHKEITLSHSARPGESYDILFETYAGHGVRTVSGGPEHAAYPSVPEVTAPQAAVQPVTFGIWEEDAYQLWVDVTTLVQLRNGLDSRSLRVIEIDKALKRFTTIVDFELPREKMLETFRAGRKALEEVLACRNGSTAPMMYCFGHSHIDVAWLWPLRETESKCARTFATQMALMEEYPEYRYLQSQPHLYWMVQQSYPELYQRVLEKIRNGQFMPEGGMWVEPDTNMAGGEALIRQMIHGKRYYREELGIESEFLWLPDVFGYSGALPQIMLGCGVKYFSTAKITWSYNNHEDFPFVNFWWEGIDGSRVLTHLTDNYASVTEPVQVLARWNKRVDEEGVPGRLFPFGYGDGGGGALRDHLEFLRREADLEGLPRTRIASPKQFFEDMIAGDMVHNVHVGEIYFPAHRGTYTSQAKTKKGNRKSELALRDAEIWGCAARSLAGLAWPGQEMDLLWKKVLLNQFHDILPGSCIERVAKEAEASYAEVIEAADARSGDSMAALAEADESALTIFNSLSWDRTAQVALPESMQGAVDSNGNPLAVQRIDNETFAEVVVPSCGWTTVRAGDPPAVENTLKAESHLLENEHLRIVFNDRGEIVELLDKDTDRKLNTSSCNAFRMYKDVTTFWDAWDIDSTYESVPVELDESASMEVLTAGPLVASLRMCRIINHSKVSQVISLRRNSRRLDFETTIDWNETHKLLKVAFPVDIQSREAIHEIQFGHIKRASHRSRPFDRDRFEVSQHRWTSLAEENRGCAVLNDCKYGVSVNDSTISLTLLKSAKRPDMNADLGRQTFTYAFTAWNGSLAESDVVRQGYDLNCPVRTCSGNAGTRSLFAVDADNVIIETVKPAEDGSSDVVVRLYESKRMTTRCRFRTTLPVESISETNMLEDETRSDPALDCRDKEFVSALDFRPFEIKTLRLRMRV